MSSLSSVFLGTPEFALPSLEAALKTTRVLAVVTQPDRPRGRGQKLSPCPVKAHALSLGITAIDPTELRDFLSKTPVDLLLVAAYGKILTSDILAAPRLGAINVHASLLPRWRGAAPIQRAIEAADHKTGVSLQKIVLELDAGDVLAERRLALTPQHDAISLTRELSVLGGDLLESFLKNLSSSAVPVLKGSPQDSSQVSIAPKIKKDEALLKPAQWTAQQALNRIRAFRAWPTVQIELLDGELIKIHSAKLGQIPASLGLAPGAVVLESGQALLGCADSGTGVALELLRLQPPNRSPLSAHEFLLSYAERKSLSRQAPIMILKV